MAERQQQTEEIKKKPKKTARGLAVVKLLKENDIVSGVQPPADVYSSRVNVFRQQRHEIGEEWVKFMNSDRPLLLQDGMKQKADEEKVDSPRQKTHINVVDVDYVEEALRSPSPPPLKTKIQKKMPKKLHAILRNVEEITDLHLKQLDIEAAKGARRSVDSLDFEHFDDNLEKNGDDVICVNDEWSLSRKINLKINVLGQGKVLRYDMQMKDQFSDVMNDLAQMCCIDPNRGMLMFNDKTVKQTDTPASIELIYGDALDYGILPASDSATKAASSNTSELDHNFIKLKLQSQNSRAKLEMCANKIEPISKLMEEYALKCGLEVSKLVFKFDGDILDAESTPEELDLEDGFCIDVTEC